MEEPTTTNSSSSSSSTTLASSSSSTTLASSRRRKAFSPDQVCDDKRMTNADDFVHAEAFKIIEKLIGHTSSGTNHSLNDVDIAVEIIEKACDLRSVYSKYVNDIAKAIVDSEFSFDEEEFDCPNGFFFVLNKRLERDMQTIVEDIFNATPEDFKEFSNFEKFMKKSLTRVCRNAISDYINQKPIVNVTVSIFPSQTTMKVVERNQRLFLKSPDDLGSSAIGDFFVKRCEINCLSRRFLYNLKFYRRPYNATTHKRTGSTKKFKNGNEDVFHTYIALDSSDAIHQIRNEFCDYMIEYLPVRKYAGLFSAKTREAQQKEVTALTDYFHDKHHS